MFPTVGYEPATSLPLAIVGALNHVAVQGDLESDGVFEPQPVVHLPPESGPFLVRNAEPAFVVAVEIAVSAQQVVEYLPGLARLTKIAEAAVGLAVPMHVYHKLHRVPGLQLGDELVDGFDLHAEEAAIFVGRPASVDVIALQVGPRVAMDHAVGVGHGDYAPVQQ